MSPLSIAFLGSDSIALPLLDWLAGEGSALAKVVAVWTQPDRPSGRGQATTANAIKSWAQARSLPVHQPEKLGNESRGELARLGADVALVMAYGHILRDEFISTPRLGTLNLHTSLLPKYRGASPIQTAIANGERETGVTLMRIVAQLDAGPVADSEGVMISPLDTAQDIENRLSAACVPLLARALPGLRAGSLKFEAQDETKVSFCRRLEKADGVLDFSQPAAALAARVNGLFPWPTCVLSVHGQELKLGLAEALPGAAAPGRVVGADNEGLLLGTGSGIVRLRRLQRPGGKMLPAPAFLRGFPIAAGTVIPSRPMPPLVSPTPFRR